MSARHSVTGVPPSDAVLGSVPESIIQRHIIQKGAHSVTQGLIKWSQLPSSLSTWEDLDYLRQQFPRAAVWGHPGAQGRGDVTAPSSPSSTSLSTEGVPGELQADEEPGRPKRAQVRNRHVFGPEWVNE